MAQITQRDQIDTKICSDAMEIRWWVASSLETLYPSAAGL